MAEKRDIEGENIQPGDMNFFLLRYIHTAPELQSSVQREMKERRSLMMALQTLGLNNWEAALWLSAFYTAALKRRRATKPLINYTCFAFMHYLLPLVCFS